LKQAIDLLLEHLYDSKLNSVGKFCLLLGILDMLTSGFYVFACRVTAWA